MKRTQKTEAAPEQGAAHHSYGPSRWPALLECSHYEGRATSADAERGTALHQLFARVLVGEEVGEPGDLFEANVLKLGKKYRAMHLEDKGDLGKGERMLLVEALVWLDVPVGPASDIYGRPDCAFMDRDRVLHVIDLKSAENPERDYLPQLIAYASGIVTSYGFDPVAVCCHLAYADSGREVIVRMSADEAWCRYEELYERIQDIASGERTPPRQCGWCELCSKFATCPAVQAVVKKADPLLAEAAKPAVWADYTPERKAQACALAETLAKWCSAVKENAATDAKNGELIEDPANGIYYGLQERRGVWHGEALPVWDAVKQQLSAEEFRACLEVRLAPLKSALKGKGVKSDEADALLEGCGQRNPSTKVFVRKGVPA